MNKILIIILSLIVFSNSMFNLNTLSKSKLISMALRMEKAINESKGHGFLIGGLAGVNLAALKKSDLINIVEGFLSENPKEVEGIFAEFASSGEGLQSAEVHSHENLESLLNYLNEEGVRRVANIVIELANENSEHGPIMGGLSHSLMFETTKEGLINAILSFAKEMGSRS